MKIAWESQGAGAPLLLIHGPRLRAPGLGAACASCSPRRYRVISFDNRGIGESEIAARAVHRRGAGAATPCRCSTRPASSARTCVGASLGGLVAQELALGSARARRQARARVHHAGRAGVVPDARGDGAADGRGADAGARLALRRFVENALAPGRPTRARRRILAYRQAQPPDGGWAAQAAAGAASTRTTGWRGSPRRRSSSRGRQTWSSTRATRHLLADRDSGCAARARRGRRPPLLLGAARRVRRGRRGVSR